MENSSDMLQPINKAPGMIKSRMDAGTALKSLNATYFIKQKKQKIGELLRFEKDMTIIGREFESQYEEYEYDDDEDIKLKPLKIISGLVDTHKPIYIKKLKIAIKGIRYSIKDVSSLIKGSFTNISYLKLELPKLDNNALEILSIQICRHLLLLETLKLKLWESHDITSSGLKAFRLEVVHLTKLKYFYLVLDRALINEKDIQALALVLGRKLPNLRRLGLYFCNLDRINNNCLQGLGSLFSTYLRNLQGIKLRFFSNNKINDRGITSLPLHLLTNLRYLQISCIYSNNITDRSLEQVACKIATYLPNLTCLKIQFAYSKVTDDGLKTFMTHIGKSLIHLKTLSLKFQGCEFSKKGLEAIQSEICTSLTHLQELILEFTYYDIIKKEFTIKDLEILAEKFRQSDLRLKKLKFYFHCPQGEFEENIKKILDFIPNLEVK